MASIDSGSDKSFDFLGSAKVVECLKDLMLQAYRAFAFRKEDRVSSRLRVIAESLPILQEIEERRKNEAISDEQASKLCLNVINSVCDLYETGAILPEMKNESSLDPRQLLAPSMKMIESSAIKVVARIVDSKSDGEGKTEEPNADDEVDFSNLSEEQRRVLKSILNSSRLQ